LKREQIQKSHVSHDKDDDIVSELPPSADIQPLKKDIEEILEEIDSVLEENAMDFVKSYVQRGGE